MGAYPGQLSSVGKAKVIHLVAAAVWPVTVSTTEAYLYTMSQKNVPLYHSL